MKIKKVMCAVASCAVGFFVGYVVGCCSDSLMGKDSDDDEDIDDFFDMDDDDDFFDMDDDSEHSQKA